MSTSFRRVLPSLSTPLSHALTCHYGDNSDNLSIGGLSLSRGAIKLSPIVICQGFLGVRDVNSGWMGLVVLNGVSSHPMGGVVLGRSGLSYTQLPKLSAIFFGSGATTSSRGLCKVIS